MSNIKVIDSIMGAGKTSWAIQYMNEHPEQNFLYITPTLDEVNRIISAGLQGETPRRFYQPKHLGKGKLNSLNYLLASENDIACTHALFKLIDAESLQRIQEGEYTLIIDEAVDVFHLEKMSKKDNMRLIQQSGFCSIDENDYVIWNEDEANAETDFDDLKRLSLRHSLMKIDDKNLIWKYPPDIFKSGVDIFVLTYLFESSTMSIYFNMENIGYEKKSINHDINGYSLVDYSPADTAPFRQLIHIYEGPLNKLTMKKRDLSIGWYKNSINKATVKKLKLNLDNYYRHIVDTSSKDFMWTCYKAQQSKLYGKARETSFVSCNARSTNEYIHKSNLAYMVNMQFNPSEWTFYKKHNLKVNKDLWALSSMLQWIWRSQIRNGKPINIYIPSYRMRMLLYDWLNMKLPKLKT